MEYMNILLERWQKGEKTMKNTISIHLRNSINKYINFLAFSTKISIFRNLNHTDA